MKASYKELLQRNKQQAKTIKQLLEQCLSQADNKIANTTVTTACQVLLEKEVQETLDKLVSKKRWSFWRRLWYAFTGE